MKHIRLTTVRKAEEEEIKRGPNSLLETWLSDSIKELEFKLRYSSGGDTEMLQGALRALDDIAGILKR